MRFALADINTLVFDCDGVILDSNRVKSEAFFAVAAPFGVDHAQRLLDYHHRLGGVSRYEKLAYLLDQLIRVDAERRDATLARLLREYGEICRTKLVSCPLVSGIPSFLASIPDGVAAYVVTGGDQSEVRDVLTQRGLLRHFAGVLGSPVDKRDNMKALASAGAFTGRSVFFGDAALDMQLAEEFGLEFVYVYGASDWQDGRAHCPHPQIADFTELCCV